LLVTGQAQVRHHLAARFDRRDIRVQATATDERHVRTVER
jgi:hypothetical protein